MPMKILTHDAWVRRAGTASSSPGRSVGKEVCLHTHFNSTRARSRQITRRAMNRCSSGA
jgi:hypothetical protein